MAKIVFKTLVESILLEAVGPLATLLTPPTPPATPDNQRLIDALNKAEKYGFEVGKYEKNGTIIGFKPSWPYIDVLAYLYKVLVDSGIIKIAPDAKNAIISALYSSQDTTAKSFLQELFSLPGVVTPADQKITDQAVSLIQQKIDVLTRDKQGYKDYFVNRFKQLNDKTATIAAEKYLNLSPYVAITDILKEYGGYDMNLTKNILEFPTETDYTIKSEAGKDPVLATIIEISKLMLVFYREYIIEQQEVNAVIAVPDLQVQNVDELKQLVMNSAGKKSVTGRPAQIIQNDYKEFTKGKSALAIDPSVPPNPQLPLNPPKALIEKINDFQGMSDTGQSVYTTFLQLFNNIKKGTFPSNWQRAGNMFSGFLKGVEDIGDTLSKL